METRKEKSGVWYFGDDVVMVVVPPPDQIDDQNDCGYRMEDNNK